MQVTLQVALRANASQKSINTAITNLKSAWDTANQNAEVLFYEGDYPIKESVPTAYLVIGDVIRWGYNNSFESWGYCKNDVDRAIAGQQAYAYA